MTSFFTPEQQAAIDDDTLTFYRRMMKLACRLAEASPDPSTQNGAVLLNGHHSFIGGDYNRFPRFVSMKDERWERPLKYSFIEHAERNVIYSAAKIGEATNEGTLLCPWAACADCGRAIVQAGIKRLVRLPAEGDHWQESIAIGDTIMAEAGVEIVELVGPINSCAIRRDGRMITL